MLRDRYQSLDEKVDEMKRQLSRELELSHELHDTWPAVLDAELTIISTGSTLVRAFIYVPKCDHEGNPLTDEAREAATKALRRHLVKQFGKAERGFHESAGEFYWRIEQRKREDEHGMYDRLIYLDEAHPEACTVKLVTKTVQVYESSCPKEPGENDPPEAPQAAASAH